MDADGERVAGIDDTQRPLDPLGGLLLGSLEERSLLGKLPNSLDELPGISAPLPHLGPAWTELTPPLLRCSGAVTPKKQPYPPRLRRIRLADCDPTTPTGSRRNRVFASKAAIKHTTRHATRHTRRRWRRRRPPPAPGRSVGRGASRAPLDRSRGGSHPGGASGDAGQADAEPAVLDSPIVTPATSAQAQLRKPRDRRSCADAVRPPGRVPSDSAVDAGRRPHAPTARNPVGFRQAWPADETACHPEAPSAREPNRDAESILGRHCGPANRPPISYGRRLATRLDARHGAARHGSSRQEKSSRDCPD